MSFAEYRKLLFKIHQNFNWPEDGQEVLFLLGIESSQHGAQGNIQDALSLFTEMENRNRLGIDDLEPLKDPFRQMEKYQHCKDEIEKFETRRRDYKFLLNKIILNLDEIKENVISICRRDLGAEDSERTRSINDVRTLFKELEKQGRLGPYRLDLVIRVLRETSINPNLLQEVEEFAKNKKEEAEAERKRISTRRAWRG